MIIVSWIINGSIFYKWSMLIPPIISRDIYFKIIIITTTCNRISKFNFSGKLKGKEKDISIDYRHFRFNADSLEKLLHLVLKIKGVEKVNDKNLGSGYTEWYFCSPKQMNAHVLTTIRAYRKILKEKKAKQKRV